MKRQRPARKWWRLWLYGSASRVRSTYRVGVEKLENRNCMASDSTEENFVIESSSKQEALIDASSTFADADATETEIPNALFDNGLDVNEATDEFADDEAFGDDPQIKKLPSDESGIPLIVEQPTGPLVVIEEFTDSENNECSNEDELSDQSICLVGNRSDGQVPGRIVYAPDKGSEAGNNAKATAADAGQQDAVLEFIPTISSSHRERTLLSPAPIVEHSRPQLFGLRQLSIAPSLAIERADLSNPKSPTFAPSQTAELPPTIEVGSSIIPTVIKPNAIETKESPSTVKSGNNVLDDIAGVRAQRSKWRASIESLRPLISQIPWISPLFKRSASERDKTKSESVIEPETAGINPGDLHRSPSDKPVGVEQGEKHTRNDAANTETPIDTRGKERNSRSNKITELPFHAIRNVERNNDSAAEEDIPSSSDQRLGLALPSLIGLMAGKKFWRKSKKTRNKPMDERPLPIEEEPQE